jgi:hypothetical protein
VEIGPGHLGESSIPRVSYLSTKVLIKGVSRFAEAAKEFFDEGARHFVEIGEGVVQATRQSPSQRCLTTGGGTGHHHDGRWLALGLGVGLSHEVSFSLGA